MDAETISTRSGSIPPSHTTVATSNINSEKIEKATKGSESSRSKNDSRYITHR